MDVFKPALQDRLSPKARVSTPEEAEETDVFHWPTPKNGISAGPDPDPAAPGFWTAVFDYEATADDELSLQKGDLVEVLSRDSMVSGDEGWWTGVVAEQVGIFPSNYVIRGNGIQEEMRDGAEQQYALPPLHREYSIVLHVCRNEPVGCQVGSSGPERPPPSHSQSAVSWPGEASVSSGPSSIPPPGCCCGHPGPASPRRSGYNAPCELQHQQEREKKTKSV